MNTKSILKISLTSLVFSTFQFPAFAVPVPGGSLDPLTIPKYVTPLVIPPVMPNNGADNEYNIAVKQFQQQILPGGIWNTLNGRNDGFPATIVWSYGPEADSASTYSLVAPSANSHFNYPSYTIETMANTPVKVTWINGLVDKSNKYLEHILAIDQTLHWANPSQECADGSTNTDCAGSLDKKYTGPVPMSVHLHGAHVDSNSDGYPEAWWLPAANNIPKGFSTHGRLFNDAKDQFDGVVNTGNLGYARFYYRNDQAASTLWFHDHSLGITRNNVYAGPAGFWLIRGGPNDVVNKNGGGQATLPGPAPVAGDAVLDLNIPANPLRQSIREIPIAIQDRSFNKDGSLFYPDNRAFFEGVKNSSLKVGTSPNTDVLGTWNPEAFFNVMVVNGVSWPRLEVAQAKYRFRLLDGCNSRFLNLALKVLDANGAVVGEIPFYQIGAEQGFLPKVVKIQTGSATELPGDGTMPADTPAADPDQALLMGPAERADVIVDFSGLADGTVVRMVNTGPDQPFGGFSNAGAGDEPVSDPDTTGQVMEFVVNQQLNGKSPTDATATSPYDLQPVAESPLGVPNNTRKVSLNEEESTSVFVLFDTLNNVLVEPIKQLKCLTQVDCDALVASKYAKYPYIAIPFGPTAAKLGTVAPGPVGTPLNWTDKTAAGQDICLNAGCSLKVNVTENPALGSIEEWEIYNFTVDAHPIHLHLVRFEVVGRDDILGGSFQDPEPWEKGFKDTIIAYPGMITKVKALFDLEGLYVWHCHIVEHEDNEMMRPFYVGNGFPLP